MRNTTSRFSHVGLVAAFLAVITIVTSAGGCSPPRSERTPAAGRIPISGSVGPVGSQKAAAISETAAVYAPEITPSPTVPLTSPTLAVRQPTASRQLDPSEKATPARPGKRILVDLSEQRVYAFEDGAQVLQFPVSTGRNDNTAVGTFKILDKKPRPYSEPWGFWMPHWMGIYWVGDLKNGFHALPVLESGEELWGDQIGEPASYGCVVLLPEDMARLYEWSEVGIPVEIIE